MSNINWDFTGKTVLVVGGSRGIGKGVVDLFTSSGAGNVWTIDTNNCDISDKKSMDGYFEKYIWPACNARWGTPGGIDILVNVAGINYTKKILPILLEYDKISSASNLIKAIRSENKNKSFNIYFGFIIWNCIFYSDWPNCCIISDAKTVIPT